eukprot:1697976-Prymnesium_polylepis.1
MYGQLGNIVFVSMSVAQIGALLLLAASCHEEARAKEGAREVPGDWALTKLFARLLLTGAATRSRAARAKPRDTTAERAKEVRDRVIASVRRDRVPWACAATVRRHRAPPPPRQRVSPRAAASTSRVDGRVADQPVERGRAAAPRLVHARLDRCAATHALHAACCILAGEPAARQRGCHVVAPRRCVRAGHPKSAAWRRAGFKTVLTATALA